MPRKRKAGAAKLLRQYEKDSLREYAKQFVAFFNVEDPIELFRDYPDFKNIAGQPEAQERLRKSFDRVREAIKGVIIAYEDFWQNRTKDAIKALQKAAHKVNELPTMWVRHSLSVRNDGYVEVKSSGYRPDEAAKEEYLLDYTTLKISSYIETLKADLARYKERFIIGVCRLETCKKLFVKDRKTQRYCSESHRKLDWKRHNL